MTRRPTSSFPAAIALAAVLALLAGLLSLTASPATAAATGRVRGAIIQNDGTAPRVKLAYFAADWTYLGARKVGGGAYSIALAPGSYYLQFTDLRPSYDVTKAAPATVKVTVRAASTTVKNVRLRRGASFGGVVKAGGKVAPGARVVAANTSEQSFESTANKEGQYALGGLPPGNYSVFTYDKKGVWVGKSTYLRKVRGSAFKNVNIALNKKAGTLLVDLYAGTSTYPGTAYVTAVSRATGQFWTAKAARGSVTFRGLYPGSYTLQLPGAGNYLAATVRVKSKVVAGRVRFGSARLVQRGGWITGKVADQYDTSYTLQGASVRLYAADGRELDSTLTNSAGVYVLDGQLATQSGLTIVAGPGPDTGYLGVEPRRCLYSQGRLGGIAVRTGALNNVGTLALPHQPDASQTSPQCKTPAP